MIQIEKIFISEIQVTGISTKLYIILNKTKKEI